MTSRTFGCRESGRRPGRSWPGDGEVSCLSFGLQLAQVWLLYWLSSDLPALGCTLFLTSLLWRVCYLLVTLLAIWMPGQQGRLLLSSRSAWGACRICATQTAISSARAQTKTRLYMRHHSYWSVYAQEVGEWVPNTCLAEPRADAKSSAVLWWTEGVWQQVEESTAHPLFKKKKVWECCFLLYDVDKCDYLCWGVVDRTWVIFIVLCACVREGEHWEMHGWS